MIEPYRSPSTDLILISDALQLVGWPLYQGILRSVPHLLHRCCTELMIHRKDADRVERLGSYSPRA